MQARTRIPATFGINPAAVLNALERSIAQVDTASYPPFNIVQDDETSFTVEMALAGFTENQIEISVEKRELTVEGKPAQEEERNYLHKGIAQRAFRRVFRLGDHVEVREASMTNGLLTIRLVQEVPEAEQPKRISITRH